MADGNLGGPLHGGFPAAPTPPTLHRPQPQEPPTPNYPAYNHFSHYDAPNAQPRPYLPDPLSAHNSYVQNRDYYQAYGHLRPTNHFSPPAHDAHHRPDVGSFPQTPWPPYQELPGPSDLHSFADHRGPSPFMLPMMNFPSHGHSAMSSYSAAPSYPFPTPSMQDQSRRSGPNPWGFPGYTPHRFGTEMRPTWGMPHEQRPIPPPSRRTSHERSQPNAGLHTSTVGDRRSVGFANPPSARRPDRSVSPRTSNRRSFDRYSTDLTQSAGHPDSPHRARRPRTIGFGPGFPGGGPRPRAFTAHDLNMPNTTQMQSLKDKLRHFLPSELPEDASKVCDICQKDYAEKHVLPTEDAEVAIQLPCKHVFGEHCINTWFDTCKTHKNKITCPMCRKVLIEPMRLGSHHEFFRFNSLVDRHIFESLLHGEDRQLLESLAARELEGDFSSS